MLAALLFPFFAGTTEVPNNEGCVEQQTVTEQMCCQIKVMLQIMTHNPKL